MLIFESECTHVKLYACIYAYAAQLFGSLDFSHSVLCLKLASVKVSSVRITDASFDLRQSQLKMQI